MFRNRRILYWGAVLLLIAAIDVMVLNNLHGKTSYLQLKIESLLPKRKDIAAFGDVRVLIKSNGFAEITHTEVRFQSGSGLILKSGEETTEYPASEIITITPEDERFEKGTIKIECKNNAGKINLQSIQRGYGVPSYRGTFELFKTAEGIVIVNELPMEEYLYAVVPSEMPASYEQEALKAQAVCARSYAYNQTRTYSYPEYQAHVDDSTSFQVYGNSKEQESTIRAVKETAGELLWYQDQVATAYYYSTSCGTSASITAWGRKVNQNNQYLKSITICDEEGKIYEEDLPWYRWTATIPAETLCELLEVNTGIEIGNLKSFAVTKQGEGGIAQQITAVGDSGEIVVETENKIRKALGGEGYTIEKQDGTVINSTKLLPSAFFTVSKEEESYILKGGGYGHGIGMSQNGANEMAKAGKTYREILTMFYSGVEIK